MRGLWFPNCGCQERLEIVTDFWVKEGRVPTFEEVSKVESASLLGPFSGNTYAWLCLVG